MKANLNRGSIPLLESSPLGPLIPLLESAVLGPLLRDRRQVNKMIQTCDHHQNLIQLIMTTGT